MARLLTLLDLLRVVRRQREGGRGERGGRKDREGAGAGEEGTKGAPLALWLGAGGGTVGLAETRRWETARRGQSGIRSDRLDRNEIISELHVEYGGMNKLHAHISWGLNADR